MESNVKTELRKIMTALEMVACGICNLTSTQLESLGKWGMVRQSVGNDNVRRIIRISKDGRTITLDDGSKWIPSLFDDNVTEKWEINDFVVTSMETMYRLNWQDKASVRSKSPSPIFISGINTYVV
jgi:hypothetical protein